LSTGWKQSGGVCVCILERAALALREYVSLVLSPTPVALGVTLGGTELGPRPTASSPWATAMKAPKITL